VQVNPEAAYLLIQLSYGFPEILLVHQLRNLLNDFRNKEGTAVLCGVFGLNFDVFLARLEGVVDHDRFVDHAASIVLYELREVAVHIRNNGLFCLDWLLYYAGDRLWRLRLPIGHRKVGVLYDGLAGSRKTLIFGSGRRMRFGVEVVGIFDDSAVCLLESLGIGSGVRSGVGAGRAFAIARFPLAFGSERLQRFLPAG
jgi:hypothetical protein